MVLYCQASIPCFCTVSLTVLPSSSTAPTGQSHTSVACASETQARHPPNDDPHEVRRCDSDLGALTMHAVNCSQTSACKENKKQNPNDLVMAEVSYLQGLPSHQTVATPT